jgi:ATP-dependent DNA ligase
LHYRKKGQRSLDFDEWDWRSALHLEQEFVIGGYTDPEGGRKYFGSLLVGEFAGEQTGAGHFAS